MTEKKESKVAKFFGNLILWHIKVFFIVDFMSLTMKFRTAGRLCKSEIGSILKRQKRRNYVIMFLYFSIFIPTVIGVNYLSVSRNKSVLEDIKDKVSIVKVNGIKGIGKSLKVRLKGTSVSKIKNMSILSSVSLFMILTLGAIISRGTSFIKNTDRLKKYYMDSNLTKETSPTLLHTPVGLLVSTDSHSESDIVKNRSLWSFSKMEPGTAHSDIDGDSNSIFIEKKFSIKNLYRYKI
jgi:hypothetical protein